MPQGNLATAAPPQKVLASVLNFNSGRAALTTIGCLLKQDYPGLDVIVFDNASVDGSREAIEAAYPQVPVINTGANLGYCGGNNTAFEYALARGYDAVIIANHDIAIEPDAVSRLVRVAATTPDAGVVGAQELDGHSGTPRVLGGRSYDFWRSRRQWITGPDGLGSSDSSITMDYVQGAFLLLTRTALTRGIRLNEEMFAYADEIDLGFQLSRAGLRALVDPAVSVRHYSRGVPFGPVEGYLTQRNRWYLVRRYGRLPHRIANFVITLFLELPAKVILRSLQGHGRYARACALGFFDGMRGITGIGRISRL